jgi:transcription elongation factor SPT6
MTDQFFDTAAELGSEEEDEDFDPETGEPRQRKTNGVDLVDSSEEEEDDDEERLAAVAISRPIMSLFAH